MPKRKHKLTATDGCLGLETIRNHHIIFGDGRTDSWLRADLHDERWVTFDSRDTDGKPQLKADALKQLIDWLTERWNQM